RRQEPITLRTASRQHPPPVLHLVPAQHPAAPQPSPLSLHDALPISSGCGYSTDSRPCLRATKLGIRSMGPGRYRALRAIRSSSRDRKSTRLNSSHVKISYAVFCLKKKKERIRQRHSRETHEYSEAHT